jgi:hypothetical protein
MGHSSLRIEESSFFVARRPCAQESCAQDRTWTSQVSGVDPVLFWVPGTGNILRLLIFQDLDGQAIHHFGERENVGKDCHAFVLTLMLLYGQN